MKPSNLHTLVSFWMLNNQMHEKRILYSTDLAKVKDKNHTMRMARITNGGFLYATIIYASNGDTMRLINADIMIEQMENDYTILKNATLQQLQEYFVRA